MHDSRYSIDPTRSLARGRMELVPNIHLVHLAIVSSTDETHLLEFEDTDRERMFERTLPIFVRETGAAGVIISSPAAGAVRSGAIVAFMERTLETFYVPIVRISNADPLIGDFRATRAVDTNRYGPILDALVANWIKRGRS